VLGLHKASFIVWFGATTIHVLAYALRAARRVLADLEDGGARGRALRLAAAAVSVCGGAAIAVATYPLAHPWLHQHF
jgi:hypothetical protein